MDEASDLAERAKTPQNPNKPADSTKINKKPLFLKDCNLIQNEKQLRDLFHEINPNIKILKIHFLFIGKY